MQKAIIICGPTASGKTDFAHHLAKKKNGEIINIDSMQIYKQIPIITASPGEDLKSQLPYHLYNFLDVAQEFSSVKYAQKAGEKIREVSSRGSLPILVGGSGLYINALLFGYNYIPAILPDIRKSVRELQASMPQKKFFEMLKKIDPLATTKLLPEDSQRTSRAYEVFMQTGKSIFSFQDQENTIPLPEFEFEVIFLWPERRLLHTMCNSRVERMFEEGAVEEITKLVENFTCISDSALKAVGVREILSYLGNHVNLAEAVTLAQAKTRQYAKRQITWFKHQIKEKKILEYSTVAELAKLMREI